MKVKDFKLFTYKGPIMVDDNCINESWCAETQAFSKHDAYNNFVMKCRYSTLDFLDKNVKITLPGRLIEVNQ